LLLLDLGAFHSEALVDAGGYEYSGNPKLGSGSRWLVGDRMGRVSAEIVSENRRLFRFGHLHDPDETGFPGRAPMLSSAASGK
jgi:hypothetical protein